MRQNAFNVVFFLLMAVTFTGLFWYAQQQGWLGNKQDQTKKADDKAAKDAGKPTPEAVAAVGGGAAAAAANMPAPPKPKPEVKPEVKPPAPPAPPAEPPTLVALGSPKHYIQALLSTRGGGVQQVILPQFHDADRLGREVKVDGKPAPLYLIPGIDRPRSEFLRDPLPIPAIGPGKALDPR